jgi:chemotaxis protein MotD
MMDQIVTTPNSGAQLDARDAAKARNDKPTNGKGGFGDTLSTVKQGQQQQAKNDDLNDVAEEPAADAAGDAAEKAAVNLRRQRSALQAKAGLETEGKKPVSVQDVLGKAQLQSPIGDKILSKIKDEDAASILQKAMNVKEHLEADAPNANQDKADVDVTAGSDAALAEIVASFLVTAEAAAAVSASANGDKPAKAQDVSEDLDISSILAKRGEKSIDGKDNIAMPSANESGIDTDTPSDATYRFNSLKGDSIRSLDLTLRGADGRIDVDAKDAIGKITENVTVLDSRRFLGLATPSNSTSIAGLIASDPDWMSAMRPDASLSNAAAQSSTGKVVHTLKLHLTPIELGSVTMSLRMVGEELAVHMTVENVSALRKLQEDNRSMMEALKAHGITVEQITISVSAADKSDQPQGQAGGQGANGNLAKNGDEAGSGAGSRLRQDSSDNAGASDAHSNQSDDDSRADGGGVYL